MLTLNQVNKEIAKTYPTVKLAKGEGYFYIYSDDKKNRFISCKFIHDLNMCK